MLEIVAPENQFEDERLSRLERTTIYERYKKEREKHSCDWDYVFGEVKDEQLKTRLIDLLREVD